MLNTTLTKNDFVVLVYNFIIMKAQLILLFILASVISTEAYATDKEPKPEDKKTQKSKYDFNIFKLYSIVTTPELPDTLKTNVKPFIPYRKEE